MPDIGMRILMGPKIGAVAICRAYMARAPIKPEISAGHGLSIRAITGTRTIPRVMKPAPPMNVLTGITEAITNNAESTAISESSRVSSLTD